MVDLDIQPSKGDTLVADGKGMRLNRNFQKKLIHQWVQACDFIWKNIVLHYIFTYISSAHFLRFILYIWLLSCDVPTMRLSVHLATGARYSHNKLLPWCKQIAYYVNQAHQRHSDRMGLYIGDVWDKRLLTFLLSYAKMRALVCQQ